MADWMNSSAPSVNSVSSTYDIPGMFGEEGKADERVLNVEPKPKPRPRLVALTDEILLKLGRNSSLNQITVSIKLRFFFCNIVVVPAQYIPVN